MLPGRGKGGGGKDYYPRKPQVLYYINPWAYERREKGALSRGEVSRATNETFLQNKDQVSKRGHPSKILALHLGWTLLSDGCS